MPNFQVLRDDIDVRKLEAAGLDTTELEKTMERAAAADNLFQHQRELIEKMSNLVFVVNRNEGRSVAMDELIQRHFHPTPLLRRVKVKSPDGEVSEVTVSRRTPAEISCPDCAHTATPGSYVGLTSVEPCRTCGGKTTVPANSKPEGPPRAVEQPAEDRIHVPGVPSKITQEWAETNSVHAGCIMYARNQSDGLIDTFVMRKGDKGYKYTRFRDNMLYLTSLGEKRVRRSKVWPSLDAMAKEHEEFGRTQPGFEMERTFGSRDTGLTIRYDGQVASFDFANQTAIIQTRFGQYAVVIAEGGKCYVDFENAGLR